MREWGLLKKKGANSLYLRNELSLVQIRNMSCATRDTERSDLGLCSSVLLRIRRAGLVNRTGTLPSPGRTEEAPLSPEAVENSPTGQQANLPVQILESQARLSGRGAV